MHRENINNTRCNDPRKQIKQTSFKIKNLGETIQRE